MMLSHSFRTNITTGYVKGTPSSDIVKALEHVRACAAQVGHPMLLPIIILSHDLSPVNDQKQRDARDWLRRLENAVSLRDEVEHNERYFQDGLLEVDGLNRDLVECHGHVMWKRPQAYWALCKEMERAMDKFRSKSTSTKLKAAVDPSEPEKTHSKDIDKLHRSMQARIDFYKVKLKGLENYIHTTLERLKVQREAVRTSPPSRSHVPDQPRTRRRRGRLRPGVLTARQLYNIMSQREARLNLEIAGEQRRIAHASKRDSTAMKIISLMGALFLPGTYLASVFSMTFFNFQGCTARPPPPPPPGLTLPSLASGPLREPTLTPRDRDKHPRLLEAVGILCSHGPRHGRHRRLLVVVRPPPRGKVPRRRRRPGKEHRQDGKGHHHAPAQEDHEQGHHVDLGAVAHVVVGAGRADAAASVPPPAPTTGHGR